MNSSRSKIKHLIAAAVMALAVGAFCSEAMGNDLSIEAINIAKNQLAKFGKEYSSDIDRYRNIIYISALDDRHLRQTRELISKYIDAQKKTLFQTKMPFNVTVILPTMDDYKAIASKASMEWASGFYSPRTHRLTSIDRGEILIHELTHALHHADSAAAGQRHPPWIKEGIASLFQNSPMGPSGLRPNTDMRLYTLRRALESKSLIPLEDLFAMSQKKFVANSNLAYAQSRYVMYYLWKKGRLKRFYNRYKDGFSDDPSGMKAFESTFQSRMFLIERNFKKWIGTLEVPLGQKIVGRARLGVEVHDHARGIQVVGLVPGGAAKEAGRIFIGDVITKFNDMKVTTPNSFFAAVKSVGAMQTATITLLRHNRIKVIQQPLGGSISVKRTRKPIYTTKDSHIGG